MDLPNHLSNSTAIATSSTNPPKRIRIDNDELLEKAPRSRLLECWKEQELYIDHLETRLNQLQQSNEHLREKETECKKLKSMLNYRILTKTTQQQAFDQMRDMMQTPSLGRLRQTFLDPSINLIYGQMRDEIEHSRKARDDAQNELQAWQFTPDSKTGKMLMGRCKKLLDENDQLGKLVSSDNVAKLEGEIALQNRLLTNMKDAQKDYEEIMLDMDTNMDAMSSTLLHMRQQLNESHRQITALNEENTRLKTLCQSTGNSSATPNGTNHTNSSSLVSTTASNNSKLPQKRAHPSNRTTPNLIPTQKLKATTNLYDVDETISSSSPPAPSSLAHDGSAQHEKMETDSNVLTSSATNSTNNNTNNNLNNNNNQHMKRTNLLENGIDVTP